MAQYTSHKDLKPHYAEDNRTIVLCMRYINMLLPDQMQRP